MLKQIHIYIYIYIYGYACIPPPLKKTTPSKNRFSILFIDMTGFHYLFLIFALQIYQDPLWEPHPPFLFIFNEVFIRNLSLSSLDSSFPFPIMARITGHSVSALCVYVFVSVSESSLKNSSYSPLISNQILNRYGILSGLHLSFPINFQRILIRNSLGFYLEASASFRITFKVDFR